MNSFQFQHSLDFSQPTAPDIEPPMIPPSQIPDFPPIKDPIPQPDFPPTITDPIPTQAPPIQP